MNTHAIQKMILRPDAIENLGIIHRFKKGRNTRHRCLPGKVGVGVLVRLGVAVLVTAGVRVRVLVRLGVAVFTAVGEGVRVLVRLGVAGFVCVFDGVGELVRLGVDVFVEGVVGVCVPVWLGVGVFVPVGDDVCVLVRLGVDVFVSVGGGSSTLGINEKVLSCCAANAPLNIPFEMMAGPTSVSICESCWTLCTGLSARLIVNVCASDARFLTRATIP